MHRGGANRSPRHLWAPSLTRQVEEEEDEDALTLELMKVRQAVKDKRQEEQLKRHLEALEEAESKVRNVQRRHEEVRAQQVQDELSLQAELSVLDSELAALQATKDFLSHELIAPKCIACCESLADQIFVPCEHIQFCKCCAIKHMKARHESRENASRALCPTCRAEIAGHRTARRFEF